MFWVSYFVLWGLFILQSLVVLLLLRQVGVLHLRVRPSGARVLAIGPEIGRSAPGVLLEDMDNRKRQLRISQAMGTDVFLIFISPRCAVCATLMPAVKALAQQSKGRLQWAVVAFGGREQAWEFRRKNGLDSLLFAYVPEITKQYQVNLSPYAILIRKDGIVISKGLVNHVEHLESLLEVKGRERHTGEPEPAEVG